MTLPSILISSAAGLGTGFLGSLVGIGGGFILMPLLLAAFPAESPSALGRITLLMVALSALAGTLLALLRRQLQPRLLGSSLLPAIPATILGILVQGTMQGELFRKSFGFFMIPVALLLIILEYGRHHKQDSPAHPPAPGPFWSTTNVVASASMGFVSGMFGVGGGFLWVPWFTWRHHLAPRSATVHSQTMLLCTSLAGLAILGIQGPAVLPPPETIFLAAGIIPGTWAGSLLARHLPGTLIMIILSILMCVGGFCMILA